MQQRRSIRRRRDPQTEEASGEEPVRGGVRGGLHHSVAVLRAPPIFRTDGLPTTSRWRVLIPVCMLTAVAARRRRRRGADCAAAGRISARVKQGKSSGA